MGLDPVTQFVITLALAFGSAAYQQAQVRRARRKLRSQLENLAGVDIRTTPAAQVVPICYGATAAPGIPVYAQTANILPATTARGFGTLGQSPGIDPEGGDPIPSPDINREQKFRSYLLTQNVLCKGGIEGLLDIHLDDKPWDTDKIKQIVSHEFRQGTASPAATAFTDERTAEDVFAGLGFVTGLYKYDTEDPVFGGPPFLFGFVHGRKVPTVVQTGTTFALSGNNTYSPNAVRCFLDYLTGPDGGPLETADLDLGAFHAAEALAERIVQGSGSAIWSHGYPAYLNNLNGTGYSTWSAFFMDHGFTGEDDSGLGDWHGGGIPVLRRYEANGNISSTRNWPDAIDQFLEVMPGAQFWRGYDGTYKLRLPRADVAAADQSVMTITPSHLYGPIKTSYPDASVKVNQLTGRFANVQLDMASDTVTWPAEGTAPYTQLRQADGLVRLHDTVPLELTNNPYHAADILSTQVLLSRRPVHQLPMRPQAFLLEPGDIVKIEDPAVELDEYAMVLQVSVGQDLRITVEVRQFNPLDFAYITADKVARALRPATDLSTGILQDVRLSVVHGVPRLIRLGWDIPETRTAIRRYEIETATFDAEPDADTERAWRFAAFVPGAQTSHDHIIGDAAAWYQFRVRVIDELEVAGEWQTSNVVSVAALNVADLPGGLSVPDLPVPPAPQALDVLCGFTFCGLDWINPFRLYQDHARTVIFRGTTDVFADAVQIGTANYLTYFDTTVEAETTYYYWAAHENTSDDRGPVAGPVSASTAIDVEALRNSILQERLQSPLLAALASDITTPGFITEELRWINAELALVLADVDEYQAGLIGDIEGEVLAIEQEITTLTATVGTKAEASAVAALTARVTSNEGSITSLSTQITQLTATVNGKADASAVTALTARVTSNEGSITSLSTQITQLTATVNGKADASAVTALTARVTSNEGSITSLSTQITQLTATVNGKADASAVTALTARVTSNEGSITSLSTQITQLTATVNGKADASAVTALTARVTSNEGSITSLSTQITQLTATVNGKADASAVTALTARVTSNEGSITSVSTQITQLTATVNGKADASAVTALTARVTSNEGSITSLSTAVTTLTATVNGLPTAAAFQLLEARVGRAENVEGGTNLGSLARWLVKTQVGQLVGGVGLLNNGGTVEFAVRADRFRVTRAGSLVGSSVPFEIIGNQVYMDEAVIRDATITNAKIANLAVDNVKIANAAVETIKIQNDAVSNNYSSSGSRTSGNTSSYLTLTSISIPAAPGYKYIAIATFTGTTGANDQGSCQTRIYQGSALKTSGLMTIDILYEQATGQGVILIARGTLSAGATISARMNVSNMGSNRTATLRANLVVFVSKR